MRIKKGFTLIELLVVVLIIGILAAIAVPRYQGAVFDSRMKEVEITLKAMSDAKKICLMRTGGTDCNTFEELDIGLPNCVSDPGWESVGWIDRHKCKNFYISAASPANSSYLTAYILFSGSRDRHFSINDGKFVCREPLDAGTPHAAYCKRMGYP